MGKSVVFLLLMSLVACSGEKKNEIPLFNEIAFKIAEGESIGVIDSKIKNKYTEHFNNTNIQIPLYKYIKHNNYEIFIGIPFDTSIDAMIQNQLVGKDSLTTKHVSKSDSSYYYEEYKKDDCYMAEYVIKTENNSLIYISAISDLTILTEELDLLGRIKSTDK